MRNTFPRYLAKTLLTLAVNSMVNTLVNMVVNEVVNAGEHGGEYVGELNGECGGDNLVNPMVNCRPFHTCFAISDPIMALFFEKYIGWVIGGELVVNFLNCYF